MHTPAHRPRRIVAVSCRGVSGVQELKIRCPKGLEGSSPSFGTASARLGGARASSLTGGHHAASQNSRNSGRNSKSDFNIAVGSNVAGVPHPACQTCFQVQPHDSQPFAITLHWTEIQAGRAAMVGASSYEVV